MKRKILLASGAVIVLVAAAAVVFLLRGGTTAQEGSSIAGGDIPSSALASVRLMVSAHGRQALTPELDATLPKGSCSQPGQSLAPRQGAGIRWVPTEMSPAHCGCLARHPQSRRSAW